MSFFFSKYNLITAFLATAIKNRTLVHAIVVCNALKDNEKHIDIITKLSGAIIAVPIRVSTTASFTAAFLLGFMAALYNIMRTKSTLKFYNIKFLEFKCDGSFNVIDVILSRHERKL